MSKQNIKNRKVTKIMIVVAAIVAIIGITMAWFTVTQGPVTQLFGVSNFDCRAKYYFVGNESNLLTGQVVLSTNPNDTNYIGKFRLNIEYKGSARAYIRVKLLHDFKINGVSTQYSAKVPYTFASAYIVGTDTGDKAAWFDNRNNDLCCYYATSVKGNNDTYTSIPMISGIDATELEAESLVDDYGNPIKITLTIETQMVQINRYPQLWNVDVLPWNNATNIGK